MTKLIVLILLTLVSGSAGKRKAPNPESFLLSHLHNDIRHLEDEASGEVEDLTTDQLFASDELKPQPSLSSLIEREMRKVDDADLQINTEAEDSGNSLQELASAMATESGVPIKCVKRYLRDLPMVVEDEKKPCTKEMTKKLEPESKGNKTQSKGEELEEEEAVRFRQLGEFEPLDSIVFSLRGGIQTTAVTSALGFAALLANVQVYIVRNNAPAEHAAFNAAIAAGVNFANLGQRIWHKPAGVLLNRALSVPETATVAANALTNLHPWIPAVAGADTTQTLWMRDYGPLAACPVNVAGNTWGSVQFKHFQYFNPNDNGFTPAFAVWLDALIGGAHNTPVYQIPFDMEGGNFHSDGQRCVVSNKVVTDNLLNVNLFAHHRTRAAIQAQTEEHLGCTSWSFLQGMAVEGTKHVDMFFIWTGQNRGLIGRYAQGQDPANERILAQNRAALLWQFGGVANRLGMTLTNIPMPSRCPLNELLAYFRVLTGDDPNAVDQHAQTYFSNLPAYQGMPLGTMLGNALRTVFTVDMAGNENHMIEIIRRQLHPAGAPYPPIPQLLTDMSSAQGVRYTCPELDPMTERRSFVYRSYVNALQVGDTVVMPIYEDLLLPAGRDVAQHITDMVAALNVWLDEPGVNRVITAFSDEQIKLGGSVHCTSQSIRQC